MSEQSDITSPLLKALRKLPGVWAMRVHSGSARGGKQHLAPDGTPDIFALIKGRPVFFECKVAHEQMSPDQQSQQIHISRAGGFCLCVRSMPQAMKAVRKFLSFEAV